MTHTYDISGNFDVRLDNFLTVPELNHEYEIRNTGLNTSSDMFIVQGGEGLTAFGDRNLSSLLETVDTEEIKEATAASEFKFNAKGVSFRTADALDRYTVVIPAGDQVSRDIYTMREYAEYIKFPMQTGPMSIQDEAFMGMRNLISAYIPPYVKSIGKNAFKGCGSLIRLAVPSKLSSYMENALGEDSAGGIVEYYDKPTILKPLPANTAKRNTLNHAKIAERPFEKPDVRILKNHTTKPVVFSAGGGVNCPQPQPNIGKKPADYEVLLNVEKIDKGDCTYENTLLEKESTVIHEKTEYYNIIPNFVCTGYDITFEIPPEAGEDAFTGIKGTFAQSMRDKYNDKIMGWID